MAYAKDTQVSVEASRAEIERTLRRYKADAFLYAEEGHTVLVAFKMAGRMMRFKLGMPARDDPTFTTYTQARSTFLRLETESTKRWEQACRQKWRALALVIKAKLEAVDAGITTIEDEFLAATVMSDGKTVGETIQPQIAENYRVGGVPRLQLTGPA